MQIDYECGFSVKKSNDVQQNCLLRTVRPGSRSGSEFRRLPRPVVFHRGCCNFGSREAALVRSLSEEIRRLRLEAAKRMLREGDRPIAEIALQAGFSNAIRLNEVFRRELKTTPGAYRQQVLGGNKTN